MKTIINVIRSFLCLIGCLFIFWAFLFNSPFTAIVIFLITMLILPLKKNHSLLTLALLICLLIPLHRLPITEINRQIETLSVKPREKDELNNFSFKDKAGIYGLNLVMSIIALPIYPEVSKETFMLMFKSKKGIRKYKSSFVKKSKVINSSINRFNSYLQSMDSQISEYSMKDRVVWDSVYYNFGNSEARYALALNPGNLIYKAKRNKNRWIIELQILVHCKYPQNSATILIENPKLLVEEGLFWVLQETGWLHPYTAIWTYNYSLTLANSK